MTGTPSRRRPEQALQIALMQWLAYALPADAFVFAIPNAAKRGIVEGAMMKRMGTRAGMPDLCVIHRGCALFLELKAPKGVVSKAQKATREALAISGASWQVVRSIDDAAVALKYFGIPLRIKP